MSAVQAAPIQTDAKAKRNDRLWVLAFSTLSVLTVFLCAWSFFGLKSSSGIYTSETAHNFGSVHEGDRLHHTFTIRNLHPWFITITGAEATCGCTTVSFRRVPPFRLMPLQSASVDTILDTSGTKGKIQEGVIITNSSTDHYNLLSVRADVRAKK